MLRGTLSEGQTFFPSREFKAGQSRKALASMMIDFEISQAEVHKLWTAYYIFYKERLYGSFRGEKLVIYTLNNLCQRLANEFELIYADSIFAIQALHEDLPDITLGLDSNQIEIVRICADFMCNAILSPEVAENIVLPKQTDFDNGGLFN